MRGILRVIRGSAGDRFLSGRHLFLPTGSFIGYPTGYTTIIIMAALTTIILISPDEKDPPPNNQKVLSLNASPCE